MQAVGYRSQVPAGSMHHSSVGSNDKQEQKRPCTPKPTFYLWEAKTKHVNKEENFLAGDAHVEGKTPRTVVEIMMEAAQAAVLSTAAPQ